MSLSFFFCVFSLSGFVSLSLSNPTSHTSPAVLVNFSLFFFDFFLVNIFGGSHRELAKNERDPLGVRSAGTQKSVKVRQFGRSGRSRRERKIGSFGLVWFFFCDSQNEWW